jgi:hypothetical protein
MSRPIDGSESGSGRSWSGGLDDRLQNIGGVAHRAHVEQHGVAKGRETSMNGSSAAIGLAVAIAAVVCVRTDAAANTRSAPAPAAVQATNPVSDADANLSGDRAVRAQDYAGALRWYQLAADHGNVLAEVQVGYFYHHGIGVAPDYAEAAHWYRLAADKGNPLAENQLGYLYEHGMGVTQNKAEAMRWFRLAAQQGWPAAQHNLLFVALAWGWLLDRQAQQQPPYETGVALQPGLGLRGAIHR